MTKKLNEQQLENRRQELRGKTDLQRTMKVDGVDVDKRTASLAFSSEAEYKRWFGIEILDHSPGAMRMERLENGAAMLWNHNFDVQPGVVEAARVDGDRVGRADVRFSRSAIGEEKLQDVNDGIIRHVSVGYRIHNAELVEIRDDDVEVWRVTDWEPYEISLVSVPADPSVGINRSLEKPQEEQPEKTAENPAIVRNNDEEQTTIKGNNTMNVKNLRDASGNLVRAEVDENDNILKVLEVIERAGDNAGADAQRGASAERTRSATILELGDKYDARDLAGEFIRSNKSPAEFQAALLEKINERGAKPLTAKTDSKIGMSEKDMRSYSLFNVVRALANPHDRAAQEAAAFEIECSQEAQRTLGKEAKGILVPEDVLASRAFNAGGAANTPTGAQTGSVLVDTNLMTGSFIEMLRNKTTIMRLAKVMGGLVGNVDIPKQVGGATAYWIGEGDDASEGSPTLGQLGLTPKTVAAYTDITRRLMKQSTPDAEGIVRSDLTNAIAQAIDLAGFYGSGTANQPRGIKNYTGINAVTFAGAQPTYAELVEMESQIAADNADVNSMAYVLNAIGRGAAKTTQKFTGGGDTGVIWEPGNTLNGYRAEVTNQLVTGDVFFGNFADLIVGLWGGLDLIVDTATLSKSGGVRIVVFQDVDFALRRVESFAYGT